MWHKCFRMAVFVMGLTKPQWTNIARPYNGLSNAPVYMKINKSVKRNIKCTVLLFILKETN